MIYGTWLVYHILHSWQKMGSSQTKEEVIISQAGNSGGQTNGVQWKALSVTEILEILVVVICIGVILA